MKKCQKIGRFFAYPIPPKFLLVENAGAAPGRPPINQPFYGDLARLMKVCLGDCLYQQGGLPVITRGDLPPILARGDVDAHYALSNAFYFARYHGSNEPPAELKWPGGVDELDEHDRMARLCHAHQMTLLSLRLDRGWMQVVSDSQVPEFGGYLPHPVVGQLPGGWFAPPAPARLYELASEGSGQVEPTYHHLRELFAPLPLDRADHVRLHAYLLAAFHADSIHQPVPLLVIDSWRPAVGKTETTSAVSIVLDGRSSSISPPREQSDKDEFVAHFVRGARTVTIDNLTDQSDWNCPWIAGLLTDRNVVARPKYARDAMNFRGRLAALNLVWGSATLHSDLYLRAWRVQLWGPPKGLSHRPPDYATANLAALQAEAYHAVAAAPEWPEDVPLPETRFEEFIRRGLSAYCLVFGCQPQDAAQVLHATARDAHMLSTEALVHYKEKGKRPYRPCGLFRKPDVDPSLFTSGRALGFRVEPDFSLAPAEPNL